MIYFENDFIDDHSDLICDNCLTIVSTASCAKKKFVDWHPNKRICLTCARESVANKEEFDQRVINTSFIGKSKFIYYDGKLAI